MKKSINLLDKDRKLLFFKGNSRELEKLSGTILAGDVGGTNSRLMLLNLSKGILTPVREQSFKTKDYASIFELFQKFLGKEIRGISSLCLGVAGPVNLGRVQGTNFSWSIDQKEISIKTGIKKAFILNDMEANAYGLGIIETKDIFQIKKGSDIPGNSCIISPGTGLGEVGLFWNGSHYLPFATEGGHCDFCPRSEIDQELLRFLHKKFDHVSWERIISGPGIFQLYQFLLEYKEAKEPEWFKEKIFQMDPAALISYCAINKLFPLCEEVMEMFLRYLAIEAAQISLKFKSTGGVFIGGGILPKVRELINPKRFQENFVDSDRMNPLLDLIPVNLIMDEKAALKGAAFYASLKLLV